jgi:PIF1-like helicase
MSNVEVYEAIDQCLRNVTKCNEPFGNKIIIALRGFQQVAPVVKNAGRTEITLASVKTSNLWSKFETFALTQPMPMRYNSDQQFQRMVDDIGNGVNGSTSTSVLTKSSR